MSKDGVVAPEPEIAQVILKPRHDVYSRAQRSQYVIPPDCRLRQTQQSDEQASVVDMRDVVKSVFNRERESGNVQEIVISAYILPHDDMAESICGYSTGVAGDMVARPEL